MILGIDLGTSNSLAAAYIDGEVVLVKNKAGSSVFPSIISMDSEGNIYTGDVALHRKKQYNDASVSMFKRSIGSGDKFLLGDKSYNAKDLSGILLKAIKKQAEDFFGEEITEAVISVPAFFNNYQRVAVIEAGKIAGFDVKRIVNEPTAAALAYGVQNMEDEAEQKVIIVLDLGGGTFDISVMEVGENVMEVVAVCGDNKLGGGDFTRRLIKLFKEHNNILCELSEIEENLIWSEAQKAKHQITTEGYGKMSCIISDVLYEYEITEEEYTNECFDLLEKIRKLSLQAVEESAYEPSDISDIIMVGGGTKLSIVRKMLEKMIGKNIDYNINPDEAVVRGVATYGALINNDEKLAKIVLTDICSHYIGVTSYFSDEYDTATAFDIIVKKNTTIPVKKMVKHYSWPARWIFSVIQCENEYGIDSVTLDEFTYITPELNSPNRIEVQKSIIIDSDGIIYAEAYIPTNNMRYSKVVQYDDVEYTPEETNKKIEELKAMNLKFYGNEEDVLLMARADRLYSESVGRDRERINECIMTYEEALNRGKKAVIEQRKAELIECLNYYE